MHYHKILLIVSMFIGGVFSKNIFGMERLSIENKCEHKIKINCIVLVSNHTCGAKSYSCFEIKIPAGKKKENLRLVDYVKVDVKDLQTKHLMDVASTRSLVINQHKNTPDEILINDFVFELVKIK